MSNVIEFRRPPEPPQDELERTIAEQLRTLRTQFGGDSRRDQALVPRIACAIMRISASPPKSFAFPSLVNLPEARASAIAQEIEAALRALDDHRRAHAVGNAALALLVLAVELTGGFVPDDFGSSTEQA